MKKILHLIMLCVSVNSIQAVENVSIINNPSILDLANTGRFMLKTNKPFFNDVVLFAANINGQDPDHPELFYNEQISTILNTDFGIALVRNLQSSGIKVQLTYLGNRQNAGWSCSMSIDAAHRLADMMVDEINKYKLDGINIDDEYSNCSGNTEAFYNIVKYIKTNPKFSGKILSKNLFEDEQYFSGSYNVSPYIDQGYEMAYWHGIDHLQNYVNDGMSSDKLYYGFDPNPNNQNPDTYPIVSKEIVSDGYAGGMIWNINGHFGNNLDKAVSYMYPIAQGEFNTTLYFLNFGNEDTN